jgi:CO/xanthine dehydrogenase FAD-binding subunit
MGRVQAYLQPSSVLEAVEILRSQGERAALVAGGTSITLRRPNRVETLVDLGRTGLDAIVKTDSWLEIGTMARVSDLASHPVAGTLHGGILRTACRRVASTPLRNLITVGGNAVHVLPWSDLPGVLWACQSRFVVQGDEERILDADEFYARHPARVLAPHEIVTAIQIPIPDGETTGAFHKESKTAFDYAAVSVSAVCWMDRGQVSDCRIVVGSAVPLPVRCRKAEQVVRGTTPDVQTAQTAAECVQEDVRPSADDRYSREYRSELLSVWTRRCLVQAWSLEERP